MHERTASHLLGAALSIRAPMPECWAVFTHGRVTWRSIWGRVFTTEPTHATAPRALPPSPPDDPPPF